MATQELIPPLTRVQYAGDGEQVLFPIPFQFIVPDDIEVYLDETRCSMGFQVQRGGTAAGGSITFTDAPQLGTLVTLIRRTSPESCTKFQESATLRAKTLNAAFEHMAAVDQDAQREAVRAIRLHPTDDDADLVLPHKQFRCGKSLAFDAEGNITTIANATSSTPEYPTLDDIDAGSTNVHFTVTAEQKLASIQSGAEANPVPVSDVEKNNATETNPRTFSPKDVADMAARHGGGISGNFEPAFDKNAAFNKHFGTTAGTVCEGNDARLSNPREPLSHVHVATDISGLAAVATSGNYADLTNLPSVPSTTCALANTSTVAGATASDAINVAASIGHLGDAHAALTAGNPHHTTCTDIGAEPAITVKKTAFNRDFGRQANEVCEGNDSRLSDARTPTAHTHPSGEITGLGGAARLEVGTTSGTVAAGNDARFPSADEAAFLRILHKSGDDFQIQCAGELTIEGLVTQGGLKLDINHVNVNAVDVIKRDRITVLGVWDGSTLPQLPWTGIAGDKLWVGLINSLDTNINVTAHPNATGGINWDSDDTITLAPQTYTLLASSNGGNNWQHGSAASSGNGVSSAATITYDNALSGLVATNLQAAVDEIDTALSSAVQPTTTHVLNSSSIAGASATDALNTAKAAIQGRPTAAFCGDGATGLVSNLVDGSDLSSGGTSVLIDYDLGDTATFYVNFAQVAVAALDFRIQDITNNVTLWSGTVAAGNPPPPLKAGPVNIASRTGIARLQLQAATTFSNNVKLRSVSALLFSMDAN